MGINVNTVELKEILNTTPATQNIMLVGRHGIGKSEILTHYFAERGMKVVSLFLGQMSDPGDLIGLPHKNEETGQTEFMPPYWFPMDGQPVVLFLDELNRARPEVLQTIMDLALNRKLAGRALPEGSRIISAVNDGEEYQLTDLDPALVSRFNIYLFRPTAEEWLLWAAQNKVDDRVIRFIQEDSLWLDGEKVKSQQDQGLEKTPDRRAWKKVSDIIYPLENLNSLHKKLVAGVVGANAASAFFASSAAKKTLSGKEVLLHFAKVKDAVSKFELHQLALLNESVFRLMETAKMTDKMKATLATNLQEYVEWMSKTGRKEALANFASIFQKNTYPKSMAFIVTQVPGVYNLLVDFIAKL